MGLTAADVSNHDYVKHMKWVSPFIGLERDVKLKAVAWAPGDALPSKPNQKLMHFIRHGQGEHNLESERSGKHCTCKPPIPGPDCPYQQPHLLDPQLTELGREQAIANQPTTKQLNPTVVIVSPLTRATETGLLSFQHLRETSGIFLAHSGVREISGLHICDKYHEIEKSMILYPEVDYSLVDPVDIYWTPGVREERRLLIERAYDFMLYLRTRDDTEIGVASHSALLLAMFNAVLDCQGDKTLTAWFETGEMRSVLVEYC